MEYEYVIFDFDGTLVDTAALIVETMHRTISALGLSGKSDAECRSMIGYRLEDIPKLLWPDEQNLSERYVTTYREIFNSLKGSFKVNLYPGVAPTLAALHRAGVKDGKPSPEPVNTILTLLGWDKSRTLVVGDMNVDILMGNRAGADTCGVTYGNGTLDELQAAGAKYLISNFSTLLDII